MEAALQLNGAVLMRHSMPPKLSGASPVPAPAPPWFVPHLSPRDSSQIPAQSRTGGSGEEQEWLWNS